jgi:hypothetical protein
MLSAQKEDDPLLAHTEKEMKSLMSGRRKRKGMKGKKVMNICSSGTLRPAVESIYQTEEGSEEPASESRGR